MLFDNKKSKRKFFDLLLCQIETLIVDSGYTKFVFGGYGEFDNMAYKAVNAQKQKYPHIKTVYMPAYYRPDDERIKILHDSGKYDNIAYLPIEDKPKKFAITYRNCAIIDNSNFCIFYVSYDMGGAYQALKYAIRKQKTLLNTTGIKRIFKEYRA